jgi:hypothetical protein
MIVRSGYLRISSVGTISSALMISRFARARHFCREPADAFDLGVAVSVGAVDVDQGDIQDERGEQRHLHARERILDHLSRRCT